MKRLLYWVKKCLMGHNKFCRHFCVTCEYYEICHRDIYGHIHNNKNAAYEFMKTQERALNAGCMINNYTPVSFNELVRNNEVFKK